MENGKTYQVKVVKILPIGAVVEYVDEPGTTELIHISNIADCFIKDVSDFVTIGDIYTATCEAGKVKPLQLTLIPLGLISKAQG